MAIKCQNCDGLGEHADGDRIVMCMCCGGSGDLPTPPGKITWRVQPAPTGRYRLFDKRGWPVAETKGGEPLFMLYCADEYRPANLKTGSHGLITIHVRYGAPEADRAQHGRWHWKVFRHRVATLAEAKGFIKDWMDRNPNHDFGLDD